VVQGLGFGVWGLGFGVWSIAKKKQRTQATAGATARYMHITLQQYRLRIMLQAPSTRCENNKLHAHINPRGNDDKSSTASHTTSRAKTRFAHMGEGEQLRRPTPNANAATSLLLLLLLLLLHSCLLRNTIHPPPTIPFILVFLIIDAKSPPSPPPPRRGERPQEGGGEGGGDRRQMGVQSEPAAAARLNNTDRRY